MLVMTIVQGKLVKGFPSMRYQYYIIYKKFIYNNSCTKLYTELYKKKYELSSDTISE